MNRIQPAAKTPLLLLLAAFGNTRSHAPPLVNRLVSVVTLVLLGPISVGPVGAQVPENSSHKLGRARGDPSQRTGRRCDVMFG